LVEQGAETHADIVAWLFLTSGFVNDGEGQFGGDDVGLLFFPLRGEL